MRRRRLIAGATASALTAALLSGTIATGHSEPRTAQGGGTAFGTIGHMRIMHPCRIPSGFRRAFAHASAAAGLEPALLVAVAQAESQLDPRAVSPKGAQGFLQLMPETARQLGVDASRPADNLAGGARYLRTLLDRFGSLRLALAAYNAGPTAVTKYGDVPPYDETERYVERAITTRHLLSGCRFA